MSHIIYDFIESARTHDGYGFFEGQGNLVVKYAKQVGKTQRRKFKKYKKTPLAFSEYLLALEIGHKEQIGSQGAGSIKDSSPPRMTDEGFADHIRELMLKDHVPGIHVMFGSSEKLRKDLYKLKNDLSLDRRQGYRKKNKRR